MDLTFETSAEKVGSELTPDLGRTRRGRRDGRGADIRCALRERPLWPFAGFALV